MKVYIIIHEVSYADGIRVEGVFKSRSDALRFISTKPRDEQKYYDIDEWQVE